MRVFLAGAGGAVGRPLSRLLVAAGHHVVGTTRSADKAPALGHLGVEPVVVNMFDRDAVMQAVRQAGPEAVIHQLTDLPQESNPEALAASYPRNAKLRIEGTRNLIDAAQAAGAKRLIVQSTAFAYAPGREPYRESDPLDLDAQGVRAITAQALSKMEAMVAAAAPMIGIVLRYGYFYGPGTWAAAKSRSPAVHVDAAAQAALLALTRGGAGIYNIAEDDGSLSVDKAKAELGFDATFRIE